MGNAPVTPGREPLKKLYDHLEYDIFKWAVQWGLVAVPALVVIIVKWFHRHYDVWFIVGLVVLIGILPAFGMWIESRRRNGLLILSRIVGFSFSLIVALMLTVFLAKREPPPILPGSTQHVPTKTTPPVTAPGFRLMAQDAKNHTGEYRTVCGPVAKVRFASTSKGAPTFIDLDKPFPDQDLTIVIWAEDLPNFAPKPSTWEGKQVCATGVITLYGQSPEIVAKSQDQIAFPN